MCGIGAVASQQQHRIVHLYESYTHFQYIVTQHMVRGNDFGALLAFAPHVGATRGILLLVLAARRRGHVALPCEVWMHAFQEYCACGIMATVSFSGHVRIFDLDTQRLKIQWKTFVSYNACALLSTEPVLILWTNSWLILWNFDRVRIITYATVRDIMTCLCLPGESAFLVVTTTTIVKYALENDTLTICSSITTDFKTRYYAVLHGSLLLTASHPGEVELWNLDAAVWSCQLYVNNEMVNSVCKDDDSAYICGATGHIWKVSFSAPRSVRVIYTAGDMLEACAVAGNLLVMVTWRQVLLFDGTHQSVLYDEPDVNVKLWHCAFTHNKQYLIVLRSDTGPLLWKRTAGTLKRAQLSYDSYI